MKDLVIRKIFLRCIILVVFYCLIAVPSHADVPASGDWTVTGLETLENHIIALNENLMVQEGLVLHFVARL